MQVNIAYDNVQMRNLSSGENLYDTPGVTESKPSQENDTLYDTPESKINNAPKRMKAFSFVIFFTLILAAVALVLVCVQFSNHSRQQHESNLLINLLLEQQEQMNESIYKLKLEQNLLLRQEVTQSTDTITITPTTNHEPATTITPSTEPATTITPSTEPATTITPTNPPSDTCGGPGWRRVAFINMTDPNQDCPEGLNLTSYSIRSCGRAHTETFSCSSVTFPIDGVQYSQMCGRVIAYRWGDNFAFFGYHFNKMHIDRAYVDGLSLTHGSPRTHIWTFASGLFSGTFGNDRLCPCIGNTTSTPLFVGNDYFCESVIAEFKSIGRRFYPNNALWDGQDFLNPCYELNNPPWFRKTLFVPTTDDIELRICLNNGATTSNIAINLAELYVH